MRQPQNPAFFTNNIQTLISALLGNSAGRHHRIHLTEPNDRGQSQQHTISANLPTGVQMQLGARPRRARQLELEAQPVVPVLQHGVPQALQPESVVRLQGAHAAAGLREGQLQRAGLQAASGVGRPGSRGTRGAGDLARHREREPVMCELVEELVLRHGQVLDAAQPPS